MNSPLIDRITALVKSNSKAPVKAYSYLRFSTMEQMKGDSLRRQIDLAKNYADRHGLELDETLKSEDRGISAFRGANAQDGALARFSEAVKAGVVPKGSFLLVENLDRLSRQTARRALRTLEDIIDAGITVVTLMDGRQYTADSIDNDGISLLIALLTMMRAHEESATKQRRAKEAWRAKVGRAGEGRVSDACPRWLRPSTAHRGFEKIEDRAAVVRSIFQMAGEGVGKDSIAKKLNKEGVPVFGRGRQWYGATISKILNHRAVLGEFNPKEIIEVNKDGKAEESIKLLATVSGYYPAIVTKRQFQRVEALQSSNTTANPRRGRHAAAPVHNILGGLATCPKCGGLMTRVNKGGKRRWPYLVCIRAKTGSALENGDKCDYHSVGYDRVENSLLEHAEQFLAEAPNESTEGKRIESELAEIDKGRRIVGDALENVLKVAEKSGAKRPASLATKISELEREMERLDKAAADAMEAMRGLAPTVVAYRLKELRQALLARSVDRAAINTQLRLLLKAVVVDYSKGALRFIWRQGGETRVVYAWPERDGSKKA